MDTQHFSLPDGFLRIVALLRRGIAPAARLFVMLALAAAATGCASALGGARAASPDPATEGDFPARQQATRPAAIAVASAAAPRRSQWRVVTDDPVSRAREEERLRLEMERQQRALREMELRRLERERLAATMGTPVPAEPVVVLPDPFPLSIPPVDPGPAPNDPPFVHSTSEFDTETGTTLLTPKQKKPGNR